METIGKPKEGHRFLDHVTDALIEAWAPTLERALAQAGLGFFETMINVETVKPMSTVEIDFNGHDELELLYNWLEELLLRFEVDGMVFAGFEVGTVAKKDGAFWAKSVAHGENYDPGKHGAKIGVKGVTYHQMSVKRNTGRVSVTFLLDL